MTIIQYDLIPIDVYKKIIPFWVKDGGYFYDKETQQLIGVANEEHLPNYIRVLTEEELLNVVLEQHQKNPYEKYNQENCNFDIMTNEEVEQWVANWIDSKREE